MGKESIDALEVWEAVITGSYDLVKWFDTSTRRFIVIDANPPGTCDLRGLTSQERTVVHHAARGESNKVIAERLAVSSTRVSVLLRSAMRKLGLNNRAQLVFMVRGLGLPVRWSRHDTRIPALLGSA